MQPRSLFAIFACMLILATAIPQAASAGDFKYMTPDQVKEMIDSKTPMHIVDIQVEEEFDDHHLADAMATYSYPVKSQEDTDKIDVIIDELKADTTPVVVVCPRGKGGAERCYNYLAKQGVEEERIFILEGGQGGWPFDDYVESK
ncbi:rhodanese-like domain-containing protein [Oceanidesulfovibrio marinus]|uniref:Rhodanese-like domain-containing protein n=1 Tax=Oceanidesulfovibrio marinus TaxID=370038 RepID=A0ABX6NGF0_9BACT|nr:rhodanese-like domain-containing protein [Oceanidesulfovibrio marinus]QJT09706.1 rhodanese-like domain-containing protein [Oceanidesulfovibrio marinus]